MKRILLPTSMLVALAVAAPAQALPARGLATAPAAAAPAAVPAVLPDAAAVENPGLGVITANEAGAPVGP